MKRQFLSSTWVILVAVFVFALTGCAGCGGKRAEDVSSLPGVYKGEATLVLPEQLKAMVKADADGKKLIPDGPVPCKLRINEHPNGGVTIEIEEFEMPMQGINIAPAACQVTQSGKTFTLSGEGNVKVGDNSIDYSHEGTIEKGNMDLTITVPLIPMLVEPQIVFKGEKEK